MDIRTETANEPDNMIKGANYIKATGLGLRLKTARESIRLTEKEAAARLYLNTNLISLMENEDFENAPPPTFMRGYLRSYARLLNLTENDVQMALKDLEKSMPSTYRATAPILAARPIDRSHHYLRWITYFIMLTLVVLVSLWWSSHSRYTVTDIPAKLATPVAAPVATTPYPAAALPINPLPNTVLPPAPVSKTTAPSPLPVQPTPTFTTVPPPSLVNPSQVPAPLVQNKPNVTASNLAVALPEPGLE